MVLTRTTMINTIRFIFVIVIFYSFLSGCSGKKDKNTNNYDQQKTTVENNVPLSTFNEPQDDNESDDDSLNLWKDSLGDSNKKKTFELIDALNESQSYYNGMATSDSLAGLDTENKEIREDFKGMQIPDTSTEVGQVNDTFLSYFTNLRVNGSQICVTDDQNGGSNFSIRFSRTFIKAILSGGSKRVYTVFKAICAMYYSNQQPREFLKKLLCAENYYKYNRGLYTVMKREYNHFYPDTLRGNAPELLSRLYMLDKNINSVFINSVDNHQSTNLLYFWFYCRRDHLENEMSELLARVAEEYYSGVNKEVKENYISLTTVKSNQPEIAHAVYFGPKSFIDPTYPPSNSFFDRREQLIHCFFVQADSAFVTGAVTFSGKDFTNILMNMGSRYFDNRLNYFAFTGDSANGYKWNKIEPTPSLLLDGISWDDGINDLGINITLYNHSDSSKIKLYAAIPFENVKKGNVPSGCFLSKLQTRKVMTPSEGRFIRAAYNTWTIPSNEKTIKGLFTVDGYHLAGGGDFNYSAPGEMSISGQCNEGISFNSDTMNSIVQERSILYAILNNGDTVAVDTDKTSGGYGDGDLFLYAARFVNPIFTDANGDGSNEILVENSTGQVLCEQKNGKFECFRF